MLSFSSLIIFFLAFSCAGVVVNTNPLESVTASELMLLSFHNAALSTFTSNLIIQALQLHLLTQRRWVSSTILWFCHNTNDGYSGCL